MSQHIPFPKLYVPFLVAIMYVTLSWYTPRSVLAKPDFQLTETEQWVLDQILAGQVANLTRRFASKETRSLRALFLQYLVTDKDEELQRCQSTSKEESQGCRVRIVRAGIDHGVGHPSCLDTRPKHLSTRGKGRARTPPSCCKATQVADPV